MRTGSPSSGLNVPLPVLFVHGKRNFLPLEAVSRRGLQGEVLGPLSGHRQQAVIEHAPNQRRTGLFHGDIHGVESLRHRKHSQQRDGYHGLSNSARCAL